MRGCVARLLSAAWANEARATLAGRARVATAATARTWTAHAKRMNRQLYTHSAGGGAPRVSDAARSAQPSAALRACAAARAACSQCRCAPPVMLPEMFSAGFLVSAMPCAPPRVSAGGRVAPQQGLLLAALLAALRSALRHAPRPQSPSWPPAPRSAPARPGRVSARSNAATCNHSACVRVYRSSSGRCTLLHATRAAHRARPRGGVHEGAHARAECAWRARRHLAHSLGGRGGRGRRDAAAAGEAGAAAAEERSVVGGQAPNAAPVRFCCSGVGAVRTRRPRMLFAGADSG